MNLTTFKAIRLRKRMSQEVFGQYLGVSESTIAAIETGRRGISDVVKARLAEKIAFDNELLSFLDQLETVRRKFPS